MNPLTFKPVNKDKYFYDKYRYCIGFTLDEVSAMRTLDHQYIEAIIARRRVWREVAQQRWVTSHSTKKGLHTLTQSMPHGRWKEITKKTTENLHELADALIKTSIDFKLVTSVNHGWVYTNSTTLIKRLTALTFLKGKEYTESIIVRPKNTIKLKQPIHTHRSYFKSIKLSVQDKTNLKNFFDNQDEHIRIGPALKTWLSNPYTRTQDYFFIDYTGESWLIMLSLVRAGLVRKTAEIISA
jgi:hypothetical protein